jgi:hypothetical protein
VEAIKARLETGLHALAAFTGAAPPAAARNLRDLAPLALPLLASPVAGGAALGAARALARCMPPPLGGRSLTLAGCLRLVVLAERGAEGVDYSSIPDRAAVADVIAALEQVWGPATHGAHPLPRPPGPRAPCSWRPRGALWAGPRSDRGADPCLPAAWAPAAAGLCPASARALAAVSSARGLFSLPFHFPLFTRPQLMSPPPARVRARPFCPAARCPVHRRGARAAVGPRLRLCVPSAARGAALPPPHAAARRGAGGAARGGSGPAVVNALAWSQPSRRTHSPGSRTLKGGAVA